MALRSPGPGKHVEGGCPWVESGKEGVEEGHEDQGKELLAVSSVSTDPAEQGDDWGRKIGVKTRVRGPKNGLQGKERGQS